MDIKEKIAKIKMSRLPKDEVYLIDTFNKCEIFIYGDSIYYIHDNIILFEEYEDKLYCDDKRAWLVFSDDYSEFKSYNNLQEFVKTTMMKYFDKVYSNVHSERYYYDNKWPIALSKYKRSKFLKKLMIWK